MEVPEPMQRFVRGGSEFLLGFICNLANEDGHPRLLYSDEFFSQFLNHLIIKNERFVQ